MAKVVTQFSLMLKCNDLDWIKAMILNTDFQIWQVVFICKIDVLKHSFGFKLNKLGFVNLFFFFQLF